MRNLSYINDIIKIKNKDERERLYLEICIEMIANVYDNLIYNEILEKSMILHSDTNIKLEENYEIIKKLSVTDKLTGIYNRHKFFENLENELARANRRGTDIGFIMFDIDHFKSVNDTYGHDVGDHVLREISKIVSDKVRPYDTFARWGGEEFIIILPEIEIKAIIEKAENLRVLVENHNFIDGRQITSSFGVTIMEPGESYEVALKRVDEALYCSKHEGRNRVTIK